MEPINPQVKDVVIEADRIYRYYCKLSIKFARYNQLLMFLITLSVITAVVGTFLGDRYEALEIGAALFAALLAIAAPLLDYSRRAGVAASIASSCMDLTDEVRGLIAKSRLVASIEIQQEIDALRRRLSRATAPAALQHGFYDKTLNRSAGDEANRDWEARYVGT